MIQLSVFSGMESFACMAALFVASVGISLSTVLNVQVPRQLMVLCTWMECQRTQISIVSAILRDTVLTSIRARCAWGSGSVIAAVMEMQTLTVAGNRLPASTLRKCQNLRSRSQSSLILMEQKVAALIRKGEFSKSLK